MKTAASPVEAFAATAECSSYIVVVGGSEGDNTIRGSNSTPLKETPAPPGRIGTCSHQIQRLQFDSNCVKRSDGGIGCRCVSEGECNSVAVSDRCATSTKSARTTIDG